MAETREILAIEIREDGSLVCKRNIESIGDSATKTQNAVDALNRVLGMIAGGATLHGIMALTDEFVAAQNEIRVLYDETKTLGTVNMELLRIANESRVGLDAVYTTFNKLTLGAAEMGLSEARTMEMTEALSLALIPFGASATQAASAVQQISMALATGGPGGVAFRSMLRQSSEAMLILAEHFGTSRAEMRKWVTEGTLSSEMIVEGLTANLDKLREDVEKTNYTYGSSFTLLHNSLLTALGYINEITSASNMLHLAVAGLAESQSLFNGVVAAGVTVLGTAGLLGVIAGAIALFTKITAVLAGATTAVLGFTISAGPLLLALAALGAVVGISVFLYDKFTASTEKLSEVVEEEAGLTKNQVDLKLKLAGVLRRLEEHQKDLTRLYNDGHISLQKYNAELAKSEVDRYSQSVDRASGAIRAMARAQAELSDESIAGEQAYNRIWAATARYERLLQEMDAIKDLRGENGGSFAQINYEAAIIQNKIEQLEALQYDIQDAVQVASLKKERGTGTSTNVFALTVQETQQSVPQLGATELANRKKIIDELVKANILTVEQGNTRMLSLFAQYNEQFTDAQAGFNAAMDRARIEQNNLAKGAGQAVQEYMAVLSPEQFKAKMEAFDKIARENPVDAQRVSFLKASAAIEYYGNSLDKASGQIRALNKSNQEWIDESAISEAAMTHALDNTAKAQRKARIEQETYNDALASGTITLAEYTDLMAESQLGALEKAHDAQSGYTRGFLKVGQDIRDFASSSEAVVTDAFSNMEDAMVGFVKTGKMDFSGLVDSMLEDMTRLLMKQAMASMFGGGGGGGLLGGLLGGIGGLFGGGGAGGIGPTGATGATQNVMTDTGFQMMKFANGGDPPVGRPSVVGERGPEIFVPKTAGTVVPMTQQTGQPVKVVNVLNPKDAVSAMNSADGERVILNVMKRNKTALQRELS